MQRICAEPTNPLFWDKFVHKFWPVLVGWCRARKLGDADTEDVTQNVLLAVFNSFKKHPYNPDKGSVRSWLFRITQNAISTLFRRSGSRLLEQLAEDDKVADDLAERLANKELITIALERVQTEVNELDWDIFESVVLQETERMEVAKSFNVPISRVYNTTSRILKRLESIVAELSDPDPHSRPAQ